MDISGSARLMYADDATGLGKGCDIGSCGVNPRTLEPLIELISEMSDVKQTS